MPFVPDEGCNALKQNKMRTKKGMSSRNMTTEVWDEEAAGPDHISQLHP